MTRKSNKISIINVLSSQLIVTIHSTIGVKLFTLMKSEMSLRLSENGFSLQEM